MDELTIEPGYLRSLILRIRALMAKEDTVIPDDGGNATDDAGPDALQDELAELVALMWVGRGDADVENWAEILQLARDRREGDTAEYLLGHPLVADYWAEGLDKLGHGSSVLEEGEY